MREQMFKWIGVLLALCLLALSGTANAQAVVTQKDLSHQKENLQLQIDQQRDLIQKDIQAKSQELVHLKELIMRQDERIADIDAHINRFEVLLAAFGILITIALGVLVYVGFVIVKAQVKDQVGEQSQKWFDENGKSLQDQMKEWSEKIKADMKASAAGVKAVAVEVSRAIRNVEHARDNEKPIKAEDRKPIVELATQLKDKPASSYSYDDWNTLAFNAWINEEFELAVEYWGQASSMLDVSSVARAHALFNQGVVLGELGRGEDEIAVYDRLIRDYGSDEEPALREQVAKAMFNKGVRLGELDRREEEIALYDRLIKDYGDDKEPALRELVARAMNGKGYVLLLKAKRHWGDGPLRQDLLTQANDFFEQAMQRLPNNAMMLGNSAYCAWLLGSTEFAEEQFKKALGADGGGETLYEATLKDLVINPVDEDQDFRNLIDGLYKAYQEKR